MEMGTAERISSRGSATGAPARRSLTGERANRIIEAMRASVAEVGITGSTFERVAAKAEVSRGLLHYYFGTKERLLIEVIRRDTEFRVGTLGVALERAESVDEAIGALFSTFVRTFTEERGYVYMVSELFVASRHRPEMRRELGELYGRSRAELAEILRAKEREGVLRLRFDAEAVVTYLISSGDGSIIQRISQPDRDFGKFDEAAWEVARFLFDRDS
jgi:AcrR family transcriptional regulator